MPISNEAGIHTKLFGGRRRDVALRKRLTAKPIMVTASASQAACEISQCSHYAAREVMIGAARQTTTCHAAGAALPVRRGIIVNRKPTAKHIMNP